MEALGGSSCWDGVAVRHVLAPVLINGRGSLSTRCRYFN